MKYYYLTLSTNFGDQGDKVTETIYQNLPPAVKALYRPFNGFVHGPLPIVDLEEREAAAAGAPLPGITIPPGDYVRLADPFVTETPDVYGAQGGW